MIRALLVVPSLAALLGAALVSEPRRHSEATARFTFLGTSTMTANAERRPSRRGK